jgi:predicted DNA-binding protein (MmcQ/YjbR family)
MFKKDCMMDFSSAQKYLLSKNQAVQTFPQDPNVAVYKVCHKMFATLTSGVAFSRINLKCDPELALELRAQYDAVQPGYQMNKKHWNTVIFDGSISDEEIYEMIDHSYDLIVSNLLDADRERLLKNA